MSGDAVHLVGDSMVRIVRALNEVTKLTGERPVVVGGLAVLCRLTQPHRATTDLDVVERPEAGQERVLEVLRRAPGAHPEEPAAVWIPTASGPVRVDVLEVNPAEIDIPSDDPGDRLHATSHSWALESATSLSVSARATRRGAEVLASPQMAEPGPLVAMKLQAIDNRSGDKQGTDLLDIVRLTLDPVTGRTAIAQLRSVDLSMALDVDRHVERWFEAKRSWSLSRIHAVGGTAVVDDDLAVVHDLLRTAVRRTC